MNIVSGGSKSRLAELDIMVDFRAQEILFVCDVKVVMELCAFLLGPLALVYVSVMNFSL